jgi:hypothetical protein
MVDSAAVTDVDPFVFVAATRYAILRTMTGASEIVAAQVLVYAPQIARDAGAAGAIRKEVAEARDQLCQPSGFGQTQYDCDRVVEAWDRVAEALEPPARRRRGTL